jgi:glycine/D-amino acid oxidase-like deaminating enzyme
LAATEHRDLTSGTSLWPALPHASVPHEPLWANVSADVVIVGAGITGAMTAQALAQAGFKVVLLDRRSPLAGSTSATTALLQYELDTPLLELQKSVGHRKAARAWQRSRLALDSLSAKIQALDIDCDTQRVTSLYLAGNVLNSKQLAREGQARRAIGLFNTPLSKAQLSAQFGIERSAGLLSYDNLSVNPLKLAAGFLLSAMTLGARIYAPATVTGVEHKGADIIVKTQNGPTLTAQYLVYATGYEIPKALRSRRFSLQSTYAIATKPQTKALWPGQALIWEASDPYLYLRTTRDGRVICGGEDEPFRNEAVRDALLGHKRRRLEKKLHRLFPHIDSQAEYAWSGTFGVTKTSLPAIGAIPGRKNVYGIMAFGGNGITFASIACELITTLISGGVDPDQTLFAF